MAEGLNMANTRGRTRLIECDLKRRRSLTVDYRRGEEEEGRMKIRRRRLSIGYMIPDESDSRKGRDNGWDSSIQEKHSYLEDLKKASKDFQRKIKVYEEKVLDSDRSEEGTHEEETKKVASKPNDKNLNRFRDPRVSSKRNQTDGSKDKGLKNSKTFEDRERRLRVLELRREIFRLEEARRILRDGKIDEINRSRRNWIRVGRESIEYLWKVFGRDQEGSIRKEQINLSRSDRTNYQEFYNSGIDPGWNSNFDEDNRIKPTGEDESKGSLDETVEAVEGEDESLPLLDDLIDRSVPLRKYDSNGLLIDSTSKNIRQKDHDREEVERFERTYEDYKAKCRDQKSDWSVGKMMESLGFSSSLFGWKEGEEEWED
ncbi:hypothetical protein BY996DRAFT_6409089 [Phakopsora pachyrhizi]|uniref:Expressed protein n=1 Tax=Phakopsora pachyrhizi TaxID=170000 RepID=A0AAV0BJA7_PHAPC|nr:hypothetical protein BY996DRAFT_6409089 [Phakopsora pachyrhizi]CAH7686636.1 expressed protein [Phakopsora pachyrhizi]